jgi:uncharacterized protein involved in type VI secretion and phage assembly
MPSRAARRWREYDQVAMAKRSRKPADLNALAASIVGDATDETPQEPETPQARAGRQGGRKGGAARADRLTPERRSEIARKAARARWHQ